MSFSLFFFPLVVLAASTLTQIRQDKAQTSPILQKKNPETCIKISAHWPLARILLFNMLHYSTDYIIQLQVSFIPAAGYSYILISVISGTENYRKLYTYLLCWTSHMKYYKQHSLYNNVFTDTHGMACRFTQLQLVPYVEKSDSPRIITIYHSDSNDAVPSDKFSSV